MQYRVRRLGVGVSLVHFSLSSLPLPSLSPSSLILPLTPRNQFSKVIHAPFQISYRQIDVRYVCRVRHDHRHRHRPRQAQGPPHGDLGIVRGVEDAVVTVEADDQDGEHQAVVGDVLRGEKETCCCEKREGREVNFLSFCCLLSTVHCEAYKKRAERLNWNRS